MNHKRRRRRDFLQRSRAAPLDVVDCGALGRYIAVHPLADETELLARLDMRPVECFCADLYWERARDVVFVQLVSRRVATRDVGCYAGIDPSRYVAVSVVVAAELIDSGLVRSALAHVAPRLPPRTNLGPTRHRFAAAPPLAPMLDRSSEPTFIQRLVTSVPGLEAVLAEHLRDNDELLAHPFMSDVQRFTAAHVGVPSVFVTVLALIEEAMTVGDAALEELIAVSFLEIMDPSDPTYATVRERMGPATRAQLDQLRELWG